jgi:pSer/pThr/pTyr-binding forkhead associated (FHA) protein
MSVQATFESDRVMETQILPSRVIPAQLRSSDGDQVVANLPLHTATSIGRAPSVGLRLNDDVYVSAHHALITWDAMLKTHVITDTNSRNGTYVDDVQVTGSVRLTNGTSIRLGMTEFVYYAPRERQ